MGMIIVLEIALCDDDKAELETIRAMIENHCKKIHLQVIISKFENGCDLLKSPKKFHAIFLDIQMEQLDGIQTAVEIRKKDKHTKIIYVTNFSNYQTDAFTVRAFGYIVKPVSCKQICDQIDDIIAYSYQESQRVTYTFNTNAGIKTIDTKDIYYFESYNHKTKVQCKNIAYIISDSVINIFDKFKPYGFAMPHKSFVINFLHVSSVKGYDIILTNGMKIPISQKRAVEFKSEFHSYLKNNFNLLFRG